MATFAKGNLIRLTGTFTANAVPANPTQVKFLVVNPYNNAEEFIWPASAHVVTASTGIFTCDIDVGIPGLWRYEIEGDGAVIAGGGNTFIVT